MEMVNLDDRLSSPLCWFTEGRRQVNISTTELMHLMTSQLRTLNFHTS